MSGPVSTDDVPPTEDRDGAGPPTLELTESHETKVGGHLVRRALPRRGRRTVGAWCFADHLGPTSVSGGEGLGVGPHPHIGLQTVTWLLEGEVLHRDSLGSEQLIRPGQLNLMTAGHGVAHAEEGTGYRGGLQGIQLWVAQPEATRHGEPAFEHHAELPRVDLDHGVATVLVGSLGGAASPARRDTDHLGVDLDLWPGPCTLPLEPGHEHALVVLEGSVSVEGRDLTPGHLAHLGPGRAELGLDVRRPTRVVLLGGTPFPEPVLMWWNYVARTRHEVEEAHGSWREGADRFPAVASTLDRIDGPAGFPWPRSAG